MWLVQVALLSLDEDETELMDHLNAAKDVLGNPLYSPQFALRVARQRGSQKASVALLCQLNLFEVLKRPCPSAAMEALHQKGLEWFQPAGACNARARSPFPFSPVLPTLHHFAECPG